FNFRQYDPQIARFLSVDPKAAAGGQEIYSSYAAMGNEPESMIDPNGEEFGNSTHTGMLFSSTYTSSGNPYNSGEAAGMMALNFLNGSSGKLGFNWGVGRNKMSGEE